MSGRLLDVLAPRMRRAAMVLAPAGLIIGSVAFLALSFGFVSVEVAGGLLALTFVLLISGAVLLAFSWFVRNSRKN